MSFTILVSPTPHLIVIHIFDVVQQHCTGLSKQTVQVLATVIIITYFDFRTALVSVEPLPSSQPIKFVTILQFSFSISMGWAYLYVGIVLHECALFLHASTLHYAGKTLWCYRWIHWRLSIIVTRYSFNKALAKNRCCPLFSWASKASPPRNSDDVCVCLIWHLKPPTIRMKASHNLWNHHN